MSHLLTGFFRQGTHKKTAGVKRDYNRLGNQSIRSLVKWILRLATNQQVGVRFSQDPPYIPRIVKWYNGRLISDYYKFNSCSEDQNISLV